MLWWGGDPKTNQRKIKGFLGRPSGCLWVFSDFHQLRSWCMFEERMGEVRAENRIWYSPLLLRSIPPACFHLGIPSDVLPPTLAANFPKPMQSLGAAALRTAPLAICISSPGVPNGILAFVLPQRALLNLGASSGHARSGWVCAVKGPVL